MRILIGLLSLSLALFSYSCTEESPVESGSDMVVVSAFLYAGQPVNDVRLTSVLPLGSEDESAPPISNAEVVLLRGGEQFTLLPDRSREGYYYYLGGDLSVNSGDDFALQIRYQQQLITGETNVPSRPASVGISGTTLEIPPLDFQDFRGKGLDLNDYSLLISWENLDASLYYVVLENLEVDPEPVFGDLPFVPTRRFISEPAPTSEYLVSMMTASFFGSYRGIVYRVNEEYADLYETREQDSRNLNEPLSNINNGLGVFSAFASDTVYFQVVPQ